MLDNKVGDVVGHQSLVTFPGNATVAAAAETMAQRQVGAVLVFDGGALGGIVTDRDLVERVVAEGRDPARTVLADVMTPDPIAVTPAHTVAETMRVMKDRRTRHLPLKRDDEIVGIVSVRDLLRSVVDERSARDARYGDLWEGFPV